MTARFSGCSVWVRRCSPLSVWGAFVAPKASRPTTDPVRLLLELAVFVSGVVALWVADAHMLAFGFGVLVVLHLSFTFLLGQRPARAS